ncbi:hypothetical protein PoB_006913100 [Plakobranchus ocellatus]|uniref:Uncharacterized protein n=1 Tax=Plakobranchus ocellatus TaxID=259542 RepID=A0AAV4DEP1_9GAST|nr:hypothetical protein PoB_006913100 [Plakobranchus ocellatus]
MERLNSSQSLLIVSGENTALDWGFPIIALVHVNKSNKSTGGLKAVSEGTRQCSVAAAPSKLATDRYD